MHLVYQRVCSFIDMDGFCPKSFRLLVRLRSDRSIDGMGRNRLLGTGSFLTWFIVELVGPQCGTGMAQTVFTADQSMPK
jgi:hypothetical protein